MSRDAFLNTFATPILQRVFAPEEVAEMNAQLASSIRDLQAQSEKSDDYKRAHQGGFYTRGHLLEMDMPGIASLKTLVEGITRDYIRLARQHDSSNMPIARDELKMWSWAAITREKDYQTPHVHAGSTLSVVYYIETPQDKPTPQGCLDLTTPLDIKEMTFLKGASSTFCRVQPQPGVAVVFPAYLKHYFHPFYGSEERIMVATNVEVTSQLAARG